MMKTRLINRCPGRRGIPNASDNGGFTLVEMMVAGAVMTTVMVALLGALITLMSHSDATDGRVAAVLLQQSIMEDIRAQADADLDILDYRLPFETNQEGTVNVASLGDVRVTVQGVVPSLVEGGMPTYFPIPVSSGFDKETLPEQLEIRITTDVVTGPVDATYVFTGVVSR